MKNNLLLLEHYRKGKCLGSKLLLVLLLALGAVNLAAQSSSEFSPLDGGAFSGEKMALFISALGKYQHLNELIYFGAIYLPLDVKNIEEDNSMRLEMRIAVQEMSARRFTRLWMDSIALNASREQRERLINEIQAFGEIYQQKLLAGDHIAFTYDADEQVTHFLLNDIELQTIRGEELFKLLLSVWVGEKAKSTDLKNGLISTLEHGIDTVQIDEFYLCEYEDSRQQEIKQLVTVDERKLAQERAEAEKARVLLEEEQARIAEEARLLAEQERAQELAREEERLRLARLEEERMRKQEEAEAKALHEKQQKELKLTYHKQLVQWIGKYVVYPDTALRRGMQGRVEIEVSNDRQGKLLSREVVISSGVQVLDRAALEIVRSAEPLPPIPVEIEDNDFTFVMPIAFILEE